jgi:hypothetical protein
MKERKSEEYHRRGETFFFEKDDKEMEIGGLE